MRIWVVIATVGRAALLRRTLGQLARQTRLPDGIMIVGSCAEDVAGLPPLALPVEVQLTARGLCRQRNAALDSLQGRADAVVFFDDDFVPQADYLAHTERLLADHRDLAGLTGVLLADGAWTREIPFDQAAVLVDLADVPAAEANAQCTSLYGCNMAIRMTAAAGLRFDERLPLYGWQEDVDFTTQLGRRGQLWRAPVLTGIHLGTRGGRQSGRKLGYSQVANVLYLLRKGTIGRWHGVSLMARNIAANLGRSLWPEPEIDRRGRLYGNLLAARDLIAGRMDPCRIEAM